MTTQNQQSSTPLPTTSKAAIYVRKVAAQRSRLLSDITSLETELLLKFANEKGWTPEQLIVFEDSGISATAPLERREALQVLLKEVERDEVKAILIYAEHHLWRNANRLEVAVFIELCINHAVLLVTPTQVYDFSNPSHVQLFRFHVEAASFTIYARTNKRSDVHKTRAGKE